MERLIAELIIVKDCMNMDRICSKCNIMYNEKQIIQHRRNMSKIKYQNRRKRQNQYPNLTETFSSIKVDLCQLLIVDIFIYIYRGCRGVVVW